MTKVLIFLLFLGIIAQANEDLRNSILERREQIRDWAPVCQSGPHQGEYSESYKTCKQGDLTIFAGLGCLAATLADDQQTIHDRCRDVRNSQGADGRWWRGPTRVDVAETELNSFSRDQSKGVLAYLVARATQYNKDKEDRVSAITSAIDWVRWMDEKGKGTMCTRSTSNLCTILSSEPYAVLNKIGAFPKTNSDEFKRSRTFRHLYNLKDVFWTLPAETLLTPKGYQSHLKASIVLIRRTLARSNAFIGEVWSKSAEGLSEKDVMNTVAKMLYKKDKKNLYFEFLHKQKVNKSFVNRVLEQCPAQLDTKDRYFDWQWQRDTKKKPWKDTNGHDCIFLMNLMLAKLNHNI